MLQPGCRAFRPTGSDPLPVEWHTPMSCRSAEEGIPRWGRAVPEGSATLPRRQTRRRRGASGAGSGPWRRNGRDRRAACIRRRGERVLRSAQGSSGRRWRARALVSSRHGSGLRPSPPASMRARTRSPRPWVPKLPRGPPVAEPEARYLEEHVAVRCEPGTAARCRPMCRQRAVGGNDDRAGCLRVTMPSGGRPPSP